MHPRTHDLCCGEGAALGLVACRSVGGLVQTHQTEVWAGASPRVSVRLGRHTVSMLQGKWLTVVIWVTVVLISDWMLCREMPGAHAQYHLHLLNDGRFPATVKLGLLSQGGVSISPPLTPTASKTAANAAAKAAAAPAAKPGAAAGKGQAAPSPTAPVFQLSTQVKNPDVSQSNAHLQTFV